MPLPSEGIHNVGWMVAEATFGTRVAWAATDAMEIVELDITRTQNKIELKGHVGDASPRGRLNGKEGGTFRLTMELKLPAAGTAPRWRPLMISAYGTGSEADGASDVIYTHQSGHPSCQLAWHDRDGEKYEQINGAIVRAVEYVVEGDSAIMLIFEGDFSSYACLLGNPQSAAALIGAGTMDMLENEGDKLIVGAGFAVAFGANNNGGVGYLITGIDDANQTISFSPNIAGSNVSIGDDITVIMPTPTFQTGTFISSMGSGLTLDGVAVNFVGARVRVDYGHFLLNGEVNTRYPTRAAGKRRKIGGTVSFYLLDENAHLAGKSYRESPVPLILRMGENVAGERMSLSIPATTYDPIKYPVPGVDEETVTICECTLYGQMNAAANDETVLTLN